MRGLKARDRLVGIDVRPATGKLYGLGKSGQLYTINPDTGAIAGTDGTLAYAGKDVLATQGTLPGQTPAVSPNTGQLFPVGRLGFGISAMNGFDIAGQARTTGQYNARDYLAIAAVDTGYGLFGGSKLVRIDLRTGAAKPLLALGLGDVVGLAFANS